MKASRDRMRGIAKLCPGHSAPADSGRRILRHPGRQRRPPTRFVWRAIALSDQALPREPDDPGARHETEDTTVRLGDESDGDGDRVTACQDYPRPPVTRWLEEFIYEADAPPDVKFRKFGRRLRQFGDLYRDPDFASGLVLVVPGEHPQQVPVRANNDLLAVTNDRLRITVVQDGKAKGGRIPPAELGSMLKSEVFLQEFPPLDRLVTQPLFLPDWRPTLPGYSDGGRGQRFYFAGGEAPVHPAPDAIRRFLDAMQFKDEADRTAAVAGAVTVHCRNHWPGGKPWFPVTANRSHAGKGTVVGFMSGHDEPEQVTYETTDWAFQKACVIAFQGRPDLGVLNIDNIRLDRKGEMIRSAFLERVLHEAEPVLFSPGTRGPLRIHSHFVITATVNEGRFSEDLMNRAVPIRLEATGELARRASPIGDPKRDFLPRNRDRIAGELRGMVEKWKGAGRPPDEAARHPSFSVWAREVGGILMVNGFGGFLANQVARRSEDDPVRRALALLGAAYPGEWHRTEDWAARVAKLGFTKALIPAADQDTADGRVRGTGVVLSNHAAETLVAETEDEFVTLRLQKARRRFDGGEPQTRYRFDVVDRRPIPVDEGM